MTVRLANRHRDYDQYKEWAEKRNLVCLDRDCFPEHGFIVDNLACVWLYKTDSQVAFLEMLLTNPDAPVNSANQAIEKCVDAAISFCEAGGAKIIRACTMVPAVIKRARERGFRISLERHRLISKEFQG